MYAITTSPLPNPWCGGGSFWTCSVDAQHSSDYSAGRRSRDSLCNGCPSAPKRALRELETRSQKTPMRRGLYNLPKVHLILCVNSTPCYVRRWRAAAGGGASVRWWQDIVCLVCTIRVYIYTHRCSCWSSPSHIVWEVKCNTHSKQSVHTVHKH